MKPATNFIGNSSPKATKKPISKRVPLRMSNSDNFQLTPAGFEQASWKGFNLILVQVSRAIHCLTLNPGETSFFSGNRHFNFILSSLVDNDAKK